jgi:hypothetical protein
VARNQLVVPTMQVEKVAERWDAALGRLKKFVEEA